MGNAVSFAKPSFVGIAGSQGWASPAGLRSTDSTAIDTCDAAESPTGDGVFSNHFQRERLRSVPTESLTLSSCANKSQVP